MKYHSGMTAMRRGSIKMEGLEYKAQFLRNKKLFPRYQNFNFKLGLKGEDSGPKLKTIFPIDESRIVLHSLVTLSLS